MNDQLGIPKQEIPADFKKWAGQLAIKTAKEQEFNFGHSRIAHVDGFIEGAINTYRHLHSQPPSHIRLPDGSFAGPASYLLQKRLNELYNGFNITMLGENESRLRKFINGLVKDFEELDQKSVFSIEETDPWFILKYVKIVLERGFPLKDVIELIRKKLHQHSKVTQEETKKLDRKEYENWIRNTIQDVFSPGNNDYLIERLAFEFDAHVSAVYEGAEEWESKYLESNAKITILTQQRDQARESLQKMIDVADQYKKTIEELSGTPRKPGGPVS